MKSHLHWKNLKQVVLRENLSKDGIIHIWNEKWLQPLQKLSSATLLLSTTFINDMIWFSIFVQESHWITQGHTQKPVGVKKDRHIYKGCCFTTKIAFENLVDGAEPLIWCVGVPGGHKVKVVWHILISLLAPQGALIAITTY